jgi:hypothetical protein
MTEHESQKTSCHQHSNDDIINGCQAFVKSSAIVLDGQPVVLLK